MGKPLIIYTAGQYTAPTPEEIDANVDRAAKAGQEIMRRGHAVICPHTLTHRWDIGTGLGYGDFMRNCLILLEKCDAICLLPGWEKSDGAKHEYDVAKSLNMPTFFGVEDIP